MVLLARYEKRLQQRYAFESRADEFHRVSCEDGVVLALKRFVPHEPALQGPPVLCVHGLGADSFNFDAPAPHGLASALAAKGFDVWAVDLRGAGLSRVRQREHAAISFDHFVRHDIPAVLEYAARVSGREEFLWIGHSMGGLVLYASLAMGLGNRIRAGITLGSPLGFPERWDCAPIFRHVHGLGPYLNGLPVRRALRWLTPLCMSEWEPASHLWAVRENVDIELCRRMLYMAVQDVPKGLALQFRDWIHHDAFRSVDRTFDYRARLAGIRTPVLVVCAPEDRLGVPKAVKRATELLPAHRLLELSVEHGFSTDYGHIDMLFGRQAPDEVFPHLFRFLLEHADQKTPRSDEL